MSIRLGFLGGASAIGASCVYARIGGLRVVVDAGIRQARGETLPDLRSAQEELGAEDPDAFVLTHAHLDHSGALPLLARTWPGVPLIATRATADLVRILLLDSLKIMELDREGEIPLFTAEEVERTLASIRRVGFDEPVALPGGTVRLLPAGHILGAGAALIESDGRRVMVTGDLSVTDQRTVPGMPAPRLRPDVLVTEATYGNRLHASRDAEERRLAEQIAEAIEADGHVLIPAFAVGRAQEILLILADAMRAKRIPRFPVYADGMVRAVCDAYRMHPQFLTPRLRRRLLRGEDPFFSKSRGFERIEGRAHREKVIQGPPCCVVASSGMLAGGASVVYASAWASDPRNLIAITGYQDEEAPGRALLELARGERGEITLMGRRVPVAARVATYHLSAHADADELVGLVQRMRPRSVYVVHGDRGAREALAMRLTEQGLSDCVIPEDGDVSEHEHEPLSQARRPGGTGYAAGRTLDEQGLRELADVLLQVARERPPLLTSEDIAAFWYGTDLEPEDVATTRDLLAGPQRAFGPDARRPYRYRPLARRVEATGPRPMAEVLALLERRLPPALAGPYKPSVHTDRAEIVLRFPFPDAARPRVADILGELEAQTGWRLDLHPNANQEALVAHARALLPEGPGASRTSILFETKTLRLEMAGVPPGAQGIGERFREETGWHLELVAGDDGRAASGGAAGGMRPEEARAEAMRIFEDVEEARRPLKLTFPAGSLVLHFAHPGIAEHHNERMHALARATGRDVRPHPHANHQRLTALVGARVPQSWDQTREPAWVPHEDAVRVFVWSMPPEEERTRITRAIEADLGCRVVLAHGD